MLRTEGWMDVQVLARQGWSRRAIAEQTGHSRNTVRKLLALGAAVPQFGDGLAEALPKDRAKGPTRVDLTATRSWGGGQVWREGAVKVVVGKGRRK